MQAGVLCGTMNSPEIRSDVTDTISVRETRRSFLKALRMPCNTGGSAWSQNVSGLHLNTKCSVDARNYSSQLRMIRHFVGSKSSYELSKLMWLDSNWR